MKKNIVVCLFPFSFQKGRALARSGVGPPSPSARREARDTLSAYSNAPSSQLQALACRSRTSVAFSEQSCSLSARNFGAPSADGRRRFLVWAGSVEGQWRTGRSANTTADVSGSHLGRTCCEGVRCAWFGRLRRGRCDYLICVIITLFPLLYL